MSVNGPGSNPGVRFEVHEDPPSVGLEVHEDAAPAVGLEVREDTPAVGLEVHEDIQDIDSNVRGGRSIMLLLEDEIIKKVLNSPQMTQDEIRALSPERRQDILNQAPVSEMQGKFTKGNPNKADSPIQMGTYTDAEDGKSKFQFQMTWKMKVRIGGEIKEIAVKQWIRTQQEVPENFQDIGAVELQKHKALMDVKVNRQFLKKAFLKNTQALGKSRVDDLQFQGGDSTAKVDRLVRGMRNQGMILIEHASASTPHTDSFRDGGLVAGERASYSEIKLYDFDANAQKLDRISHSIGHDTKSERQARALVDAEGNILRGAAKADAVMTKWGKVPKDHSDSEIISAEEKHFQQALKMQIVGDPRFDAVNELARTGENVNIVEALRTKNEELEREGHAGIPFQSFKKREEELFKKNKTDFKGGESALRLNLLNGAVEQAGSQGFSGKLAAVALSVGRFFNEDGTVTKLMTPMQENYIKALDDLRDAIRENVSADIKTAAGKLQEASDGVKSIREHLDGLKEKIDSMKLQRTHIEQLGADPEGVADTDPKQRAKLEARHKGLLSVMKGDIEKAEKLLVKYEPVMGLDLAEATALLTVAARHENPEGRNPPGIRV